MGYTPRVEWPKKPNMGHTPSIEARISELNELRDNTMQAIVRAQEVTKKGRLGNRNFKPYNKGDQVWIKGTNLKTLYPAKKLGPKQYGPFKVTKQLSPAVYEVALPHSWKIHNVFHVNLITPYKETELHGPNFTRPPPDLINGKEEYEIEKILDAQQRG